ncbi:CU044_2847 family protein [Glycomyces harbinensis]|uniref:Trypsin-co-occurring domain-containing protein n=1 Tax=Glycomyces harbinensis TaxID=58114 RepID=A0A1G6R4Y3_9ACTN|nr:CU044_2847 family protein [Glycomyces harbinensis]SDC99314.1 hypothetical protein SAMN05216270_101282 [Glycomyces harbinensis]
METVGFALDDDENGPVVLVDLEIGDGAPQEGLERAGLFDAAARRAKITFDEALASIPAIARAVRAQVASIDEPPTEVTLSVGLKFTGETNVKIVSGKSEAHLNLTMKWENER